MMDPDVSAIRNSTKVEEWRKLVVQFEKPSLLRAVWQLVNTLGPFFLLWYFMYLSISVSWWLVWPQAVLAAMAHFSNHRVPTPSPALSLACSHGRRFITGAGSIPFIMRVPGIWTSAGWATFGR